MGKLIITQIEIDARKCGGIQVEDAPDVAWQHAFITEIPKSIEVSIDIQLTTSGDFEKYWDDLDSLKKEVFLKIFGEFIKDDKFEIEI